MGGEQSIVLSVPIKGIDKGDVHMNVYMSAPSGKSMAWYIGSNSKGVKEVNGTYTIELPLAPHHERGVYILEEINMVEEYRISSSSSHQIVFQSHNHQSTVVFKERGIRKTISVSGASSPSEQF